MASYGLPIAHLCIWCYLLRMTEQRTVRVTISLTPERLAKLDRVARSNSRNRSNTIARMIDLAKDAE